MAKTNPGRFFEDYKVGQVIRHAVPRTVAEGERALYHALYPARHALYSSDEFAAASGLDGSPLDDLIAFHVVFGKTVPDVSLNAVANLGYAEGRWLKPVWPGDTLRSESEVIGVKENSNGKSGVVYVRTRGLNQMDEVVLDYVRWVMVRKGDLSVPAPETVLPALQKVVPAEDLVVPEGLDFSDYDFGLAGESHRWGDYEIGEKIDHVDGVTIEEAEHMIATRLWQNTAKVHFDATFREDGKRLIYGAGAVVQRPCQCADDRGAERRRACEPLLCRRHRQGLVRGARQGRDRRPGRRRDPAAAGRGQAGRGRVRAEGRRRQIRARGAARSRLLGADADVIPRRKEPGCLNWAPGFSLAQILKSRARRGRDGGASAPPVFICRGRSAAARDGRDPFPSR